MGITLLSRHRIATLVGLGLLALLHRGCASTEAVDGSGDAPLIRVRLLSGVDKVELSCGVPPSYRVGTAPPAPLNCPKNAVFTLSLTRAGWQAGNANLGGNVSSPLDLEPQVVGSVSINGTPYRGRFRFLPAGDTKFDVINEVDVEGYLMSVVPKEMFPTWHQEALMAQAIVSRTYVLYERQTAGRTRAYDVMPDTKSQVYGGIAAETAKSRQAVVDTKGVVVSAPDPDGQYRIFKTYFSSTCGGVTLSASDAFGDPYIPALSDQNAFATCRAAPRFNWGPIEVRKDELTRRFVAWGRKKGRPEQNMAAIARVDVQAHNRWNRPVRFLVTDVKNAAYSLSAEEFRWAVNTNATEGTGLLSSFVKIINDSDKVRFVEGHGWGHGVGMCQWCAEARAEAGLPHGVIITTAYPTARLDRAY